MKRLNEYLKDTGVKYMLNKSSYRNGDLGWSISYVLTNEDPIEMLKTQLNAILKEQNISLSEAAELSGNEDGIYIDLNIDKLELEWSFCEKWSYSWVITKI